MSNYSTVVTRNAAEASRILKAIANPNRLMILCQLKILGSCHANRLLENLSISQPALSQHLAVMTKEKLIVSTKEGSCVYFSIRDDIVKKILEALDDKFCKIEDNQP